MTSHDSLERNIKNFSTSEMASFSCGISGELCKNPYVTPSGGVYEKENIFRWISENGTDPATQRALAKTEIIEMKQSENVRPHPPQAMTIPAIIKSLRYDSKKNSQILQSEIPK